MIEISQCRTKSVLYVVVIIFLCWFFIPMANGNVEPNATKEKKFEPFYHGLTQSFFESRSSLKDQKRRNEIVHQMLNNDIVDPEPVLIDAIRQVFDTLYDTSGRLELIVYDEDKDIAGLRIKERYIDPNGDVFTFQEDYPVWIDTLKPPAYGHESVNMRFRLRKDENQWQEYVDHVKQVQQLVSKQKENGSEELDIEPPKKEMPLVWMSSPEPNKVRVFVSVYDRAGNESEYVEIDNRIDSVLSLFGLSEEFGKDSDEHLKWQPKEYNSIATTDQANAALLYYQALLSLPERDLISFKVFDEILRDKEIDKKSSGLIKKYLNDCLYMLKLTEAATRIPDCNWGRFYSYDFGGAQPAGLRQLCFHLYVAARIFAFDGNYRTALGRCMTIRRMARHAGDDTLLAYFVSVSIDAKGLHGIQELLSDMFPDLDTLIWLQGQLATTKGAPESFSRAMEFDLDHAVQYLRNNPEGLKLWRLHAAIVADLPYDVNEAENISKSLLRDAARFKKLWSLSDLSDQEIKETLREIDEEEVSEDDIRELKKALSLIGEKKQEIKKLVNATDEQLLEYARQSYSEWLNPVIRVIESDIPYQEKYAELRRIEDQRDPEPDNLYGILFNFEPADIFYIHIYPDLTRTYDIMVRHRARLNAIKAAIEIYLVRAQTGELPEELPENLPKDPYSSQDFEYEITDDGFILRCRGMDIDASPRTYKDGKFVIESEFYHQYEFKIQNNP